MKLIRYFLLLLLLAALLLHPICAESPSKPSDPADSKPKAPAEKDTPADNADSKKASESPSPPEDKAVDDEPQSDSDDQIAEAPPVDDGDDDQIEEAPPVDKLPGGVGDLSVSGPCAEDIGAFCMAVKPGGSHLAECIQNQIMDEEQGATEFTAQVTEKCKSELLEYKMTLVGNINMDEERRKVCKKDAHKICGAELLEREPFPGEVIACLTNARTENITPTLSKKCSESIYQAQLDAAQDYRLNAVLYAACKQDADSFCKHVEPGAGRVNSCLRDKLNEISWDCRATLFKIDFQDADDARLSVKLFRTCLADKRKFCPDVAPGNGRAKACLEEHRKESGFDSDCKDMIEKMMEARSQDYRLDPALRKDCQNEIKEKCGYQAKAMTDLQSENSQIVECLQDFSDEFEDPCQAAVARTISRGSDDIRFAVVMAKACKEDRDQYCKSIPPGDARVIRCLEESREHLSDDCKISIFDHMTRMSEDIDFNKPLKDACSSEIKENCEGVNPGHSRVVRCLQEGKRRKYSDSCKQELQRLEKEMGRDYRLNYRLDEACDRDAKEICGKDVCDRTQEISCGGKVLHCLVEKKDEIKAESCKQEVYYYIKMEVTNFGNDIILAEKCREDVEKFCTLEEAGEGRVHACLRTHREEISKGCAAEELKLEIEESGIFELRTNLKQACASERDVFCSEIQTGQARVFRCLVHNLGKADFGETCKKEVMTKLSRRQQNWKLDVTLRKACKEDAATVCKEVDHDADHAEVTRCLMKNHANVTEPCQHEDQAPLSAMCASDVKTCKTKNPLVVNYPGKILTCLTTKAGRNTTEDPHQPSKLSEDCATIYSIAQPPDSKDSFDSWFEQLGAMNAEEKMAHVGVWDHQSGVTITGYTALACFSALCTTVVLTAMYAFKQWKGIKDPATGYVQVIKQGDV